MDGAKDALLQSAAQTIAQHHMLRRGETVLAALSGGADSVALALVLQQLGYRVCAFHLNHCLRGAESERDEAFVRSFCKAHDIPLQVARADAAAYAETVRESLETAARMLRYAHYEAAAAACGASHIATAHTADDQLETLLLHLTRGTGGKGLGGIPPVRGAIVRPLLEATRAQVEAFLAACGQDFVVDSSNADSAFSRNRIRNEVIPVLRSINPSVAASGLRLSALLRQDESYLEAEAGKLLETAAGPRGVSAAALQKAHPAVSSRALRLLLMQAGVPMRQVGEQQILLLDGLCRSENPSAQLDLPGKKRARREYDCLIIEDQGEEKDALWAETPVTLPFRQALWENGPVISLRTTEKNGDFYKTFNTFYADCGTIDFRTLSVRPRQAGDRLRLHENSGSKTLKRLMIDRKIPREKRDRLAVLADGSGVIAVQTLGVDWSRRPQGGAILEIQFEGKPE